MYECPYDVPLVLPDKAHAVESSPGSLFGNRVLRFRLPRFLLLTVRHLLLPEGGGGGLFRSEQRTASEGLFVASDQFPDALYLAFRGNGVLGFIHSVIPSTGHAVFSPVLHFLFHTPEHVLEREVVLDFRAQPHFFLPAVLFFR